MGDADEAHPAFLDRVVEFPTEGTSYELLKPLTSFRKCHDGTPAEGRILFTCRQSSSSQQNSEDEFVIKIKVQYSGQELEAGPSNTTAAELKALEAFSKDSNPYTPHLVSWKQEIQGPTGLLPGGYITYTVMTKMPGEHLLNRYWSLPTNERENVVQEFLPALRSIFRLGIEPIDRALRNIMWEPESRRCTIIDFELWQETSEKTIADETKELQRWGLARRPPPLSWWAEWNAHMR